MCYNPIKGVGDNMRGNRVSDLTYCALFTSLICVGAFIKIPLPNVPLTMQMTFVTLSGMILGAKNGARSCLLYLLIGLIGIPVFAQGGGISYILNPSFGYILAFIPGAYFSGLIAHSKKEISYVRFLLAGLSCLLIVYSIGIIYYTAVSVLYIGATFDIRKIVAVCLIPVLPSDILMTFIMAYAAYKIIPIIKSK